MLLVALGQIFGLLLLFCLGLRLSAFFSGIETGFYRVSVLRLAIDAQDGSKKAASMLSFLQHPTRFVTTILVGNNLANYLVTWSVGLASMMAFQNPSELLDIALTMCMAPVIFLFGELLPKTLYYRAPLALLNRNFRFFQICYYLFWPVTWPLVQVTKRFQKASGISELSFWGNYDENRLYYLLGQGHQEGVLTPIQNQLVHGIFEHIATTVERFLQPVESIMGVDDDATREQIAEFGKRMGKVMIPVRKKGSKSDWYGYYLSAEIAISPKPLSRLVHYMPSIPLETSRLDALQMMRHQHVQLARVVEQGKLKGLIPVKVLVEQLFRDAKPQLAGTPLFQSGD